jgi:hypothetical protein
VEEVAMQTRGRLAFFALFALVLASCTESHGGVFAVNPETGEIMRYPSASAVPAGWIVCESETECPDTCAGLEEATCLRRDDCTPVYVGIGAYPRECDSAEPPPDICDGTVYAGCVPDDDEECSPDECGPAPGAPAYICPDGSVGGSTGRCVRTADGACGWEFRECPDDCTGTVPMCDLACPPGTHHPVDRCGRVLTCECVPDECPTPAPGEDEAPGLRPACEPVCPPGSHHPIDPATGCVDGCLCVPDEDCSDVPACRLACPPGTHNPVDERGCVHTCECVPDEECTADECGPAPLCPAVLCPDGTTGGCTGRCYRTPDGTCGWEIRECPEPRECTPEECGPAPECPAIVCEDGSIGGCTDRCLRGADGACGWEIRECPPVRECVAEGGSCAGGETCCGELNCCAGVPVPPGEEYCGRICPISDRESKENFESIDPQEVLSRVASLELSTWNYLTEPDSVRHMGPMAQDFRATFGLGPSERHIATVDADGVALAAIQALNANVEALRRDNEELRTELRRLQSRVRRESRRP